MYLSSSLHVATERIWLDIQVHKCALDARHLLETILGRLADLRSMSAFESVSSVNGSDIMRSGQISVWRHDDVDFDDALVARVVYAAEPW